MIVLPCSFSRKSLPYTQICEPVACQSVFLKMVFGEPGASWAHSPNNGACACSKASVELPVSSSRVRKSTGWRLSTGPALFRLRQGQSSVGVTFFLPPCVWGGDKHSHMSVPLPPFVDQHCTHNRLCHLSANVNTVTGQMTPPRCTGAGFGSTDPRMSPQDSVWGTAVLEQRFSTFPFSRHAQTHY